MEVSAEAKRIMVVALGKLYSSRTQRGGLRLHRSLLLTLVMKSARDIYHAAQEPADSAPPAGCEQADMTTTPAGAHVEPQGPARIPPAENKENRSPAGSSRKRRGKAAAEPDFLPCKKAKLDQRNQGNQGGQGNQNQNLQQQFVLMDFVNCGSELGPGPALPLQRAVAAC